MTRAGVRRRSFAIVLLIGMLESGYAMAAMCSSRDGQKYCSCDYNQECTSREESCACVVRGSELRTPVLSPPPARLQSPISPMPDVSRRESAPAITDNDERTPAEYIQLAQTAITAGKSGTAIEYIDKGQTRLLDRSVALNRTFDPITDESIKQLTAAKQALLGKDRERAMRSLDAALAAMQ